MATKTDYYNRIIASLQVDIRNLQSDIAVLKNSVEKSSNTSGKTIKTSSMDTSNYNGADWESKITTVCHDIIDKRWSDLSTKFVDMEMFRTRCNKSETQYLLVDEFHIFKESIEGRFRLIENEIHSRYALLTMNHRRSSYDLPGIMKSKLDTFLGIFTMNTYTRWLMQFLIIFSLILALLLLISETRHISQENSNLYQTIEILKNIPK